MKRTFLIFIAGLLVLCVSCQKSGQPEYIVVKEASGIIRVDDKLLMVSDDADGRYFELRLPEGIGRIIPIDPLNVREIRLPGAELALDLESLDVLADGRLVFLSEQLRCLIARETPESNHHVVVAEYDRTLTEFGHRGLEGVAVKHLENGGSRVAVLWEGGYPECADVPPQLLERTGVLPLKPVITVHDIGHGGNAGVVRDPVARIFLDVPEPEGDPPVAQRFRAADLVWHGQQGAGENFIVLLSSSNFPEAKSAPPRRYKTKMLQRFDFEGTPVGEPLDMKKVCSEVLHNADEHARGCAGEKMSSHVREIVTLLDKCGWENVNWEGLGWYDHGQSLVTVYDGVPKDPPVALVIEIPDDWK